jgi:hypothetical protein
MAVDRLRDGSSGKRKGAIGCADAKRICSGKSTLTLTQKVLEMISGTFFVTTFIAPFSSFLDNYAVGVFCGDSIKKSFS